MTSVKPQNIKYEDFKCLQCGTCCQHLVNDTSIGKAGLPINENERSLFPAVLVFPSIGIGSSGKGKIIPKKVLLYQVVTDVCPHLVENICEIYENRPLICKSYPVIGVDIPNKFDVFVSGICKSVIQIQELSTPELTMRPRLSDEYVHAELLFSPIREYIVSHHGARAFTFNIVEKSWKVIKGKAVG